MLKDVSVHWTICNVHAFGGGRPTGHIMAGTTLPRFFIYGEPALNHAWLQCAPAYKTLLRSAHGRFMAEAGLHESLARHDLRTHDLASQDEMTLYMVAIYEYTSFKLGTIPALTLPCPPLEGVPVLHLSLIHI